MPITAKGTYAMNTNIDGRTSNGGAEMRRSML